MRSRALLAAAGLVFVAACGARSSLRVPIESTTGSGGAGGGVSTAVGSGGAGPGSGGASPALCATLVHQEPSVALQAPDASTGAHDPLLQLLAQGDVLALSRRTALESPGIVPDAIGAVRLDPWGVWPPTIHPPALVTGDATSASFVASAEPLGTFSLGVERFPKNAPPGCSVSAVYGISPDSPPGPPPLDVPLLSACDDLPRGIATLNNGLHYVAVDGPWSDGGAPKRSFSAHLFDNGGAALTPPIPTVCASTPFVGDVIASGEEFLFVHSAGGKDDCSDAAVPATPARRLIVGRRGKASMSSAVVVEGSDDMVHAQLLPRSTGAWLIFRESGASAEVQPPGMAMLLGPNGEPGTAFPITSPGAGRISATALGDGFVVAIVDAVDPAAPNILVGVHSSDGTIAAETSFNTAEGWLNGDRLTLVASPSGTSFLVGWAGASKAPPGSEVFVHRLDCVTPD